MAEERAEQFRLEDAKQHKAEQQERHDDRRRCWTIAAAFVVGASAEQHFPDTIAAGKGTAPPDRPYLSFRFWQQFGYWPDPLTPQTFNEKLLWYKLAAKGGERLVTLVDKHAVKEYVAAKIGAENVIPNLWSGETLRPCRSGIGRYRSS